MTKQPSDNYSFKCIFIVLAIFFVSYSSFSQNIASTDSSKVKKQPNPPADSSQKYGYGRLVLLGHVRNVPLQALPDSDGDGVPDQFDLEPNTPPGVAVDSRGRALDTDGDGVPDYKDKEKLTPQKCFPVDSNGVGTCPEPGCCIEAKKAMNDSDEEICCRSAPCNLISLPSVAFKKESYKLTTDAIESLSNVAKELRENPPCRVKVIGYYGGVPSMKAQQLSWDRVNAVIKYLVEKQGILEARFVFVYGQQGPSNAVEMTPTTETGPNFIPPPSIRHQ